MQMGRSLKRTLFNNFSFQEAQGGPVPEYCAQGAMISYSTVWPHLAMRAFALHILCGWGWCGEFCFQGSVLWKGNGAFVGV